MKRYLAVLAVLAVASSLCAQEEKRFTKEEVLAIFAQYHPAALAQAEKNAQYNALLQEAVQSFNWPVTTHNRAELFALVHNFDSSILLQALGQEYARITLLSGAMGATQEVRLQALRADAYTVFDAILNNTLKARQYEIDLYEEEIKALKKQNSLTKQDRFRALALLNSQIKDVKAQIKTLKKDQASQLRILTDSYLRSAVEKEQSAALDLAQQSSQQAAQTPNLQIKNKNKKPVAK